jgi:hypothetical protein
MTTNYPNTDPSDKSFVSVYGVAEVSEAGIRHVLGCFATLGHVLTQELRKMLSLTGFNPEIGCEELSIPSQVRWLTVIVCTRCPDLDFDLGTEDPIESWREVAAQCIRSDEWWSMVDALDREEPAFTRENSAANPVTPSDNNRGWNGPNLLDVADYIRTAESYVGDIFRYCRKRRRLTG